MRAVGGNKTKRKLNILLLKNCVMFPTHFKAKLYLINKVVSKELNEYLKSGDMLKHEIQTSWLTFQTSYF